MTPHHTLDTKKGFNLIEVAIVLGVVGMALGGIWLAAATVRENQQIASVSQAVIYSHQRLKDLYKGQDLPVSGTSISSLSVKLNLMPTMPVYNSLYYAVPWNNSTNSYFSFALQNPYLYIYVPVTDTSRCIKLVKAVIATDSVAVDIGVSFQSSVSYTVIGSISPAASNTTSAAYNMAQTYCPTTGRVVFYFEK